MRLLRSLLSLYPRAYRSEYGEEMLAVLTAIYADIRRKGPGAQVVAYLREVEGLLSGALREHLCPWCFLEGFSFDTRRFSMRSEFRFPKSTVTLMTLILAAVVMAIEKAKAISASVPHGNPPVGPIQPEHFATVSTLLVLLGGMAVAGALVSVVQFALHRSGIQRLSALDPSRHETKA